MELITSSTSEKSKPFFPHIHDGISVLVLIAKKSSKTDKIIYRTKLKSISELKFDENANKITRWMSEHILKSFASTAWSKDPYLTREMRSIFNNCMKPPF